MTDLETETWSWAHPAHKTWRSTGAAAVLGTVLSALVGFPLLALDSGVLVDPPGERPEELHCGLRPQPCVTRLPGWLVRHASPEEVRKEAEYRMLRQIEAHSAEFDAVFDEAQEPRPPETGAERAVYDRFHREMDARREALRVELGIGPVIVWNGALEHLELETSPRPQLTLEHGTAWANRRARDLAERERDAYENAIRLETESRMHRMEVSSQQALLEWVDRNTRWQRAILGLVLSLASLGLAAFAVFAHRRELATAPREVVLQRFAVTIDGNRTLLAGLTDGDLHGILLDLKREGHRCSRQDALLEALRARRDAAERGELPSAAHRDALGQLLS
ncbi:MAG: hypothetical protein H6737_22900 [Alphaproteobacteria bacterium]|nr:hypothetical protein [Alphaproteobacteria bacterium]